MIKIDNSGRIIPTFTNKVFSTESSDFYQCNVPDLHEKKINEIISYSTTNPEYLENNIQNIHRLFHIVQQDYDLRNLLLGPSVPFTVPYQYADERKIFSLLNEKLFPMLKSRYESVLDSYMFNVKTQGNLDFSDLTSVGRPGLEHLMNRSRDRKSDLVGCIFPMALSGYSLTAQLQADKLISQLSKDQYHVCVGGILETTFALLGYPTLLTHSTNYSPLICLPHLKVPDPRYFFCYKSYGQALEFWGIPKEHINGEVQISEQWTASIVIILKS